MANLPSGYQITNPLPGGGLLNEPVNAIMAPWHDILLADPAGFGSGNGSVFIAKTGVSPNRKFIATWCSAAMFSCTDSLESFQIVLPMSLNVV